MRRGSRPRAPNPPRSSSPQGNHQDQSNHRMSEVPSGTSLVVEALRRLWLTVKPDAMHKILKPLVGSQWVEGRARQN